MKRLAALVVALLAVAGCGGGDGPLKVSAAASLKTALTAYDDQAAFSFAGKGARWVTCDRWISAPSEPIRQVRYHEPPYGTAPAAFDDARFNRSYDLGPITWR